MAVETGLAIKGSDGAVIIQCKTSGTVCNVVEETFGMCLHNNIPVPQPPSSFTNYMLKVCGRDEYMENDRCLKDYNYVHQCIKLSIPVHVVLVERSLVKQLVSNTGIIKPETTSNSPPPLSQDEITILYDSYLSKDEEFRYQMTKPPLNYIRHYQQVTACIKMLCERAGSIEPLCVSESIFNLKRACRSAMGRDSFAANIAVDLEQIDGGWSSINASSLREEQKDAVRDVTNALDIVKTSVHETIDAYCQNMNTPYEPVWVDSKEERLVDGEQKLRVKLCGLHRVLVQEMYHYDSFQIDMCMYYGGRAICKNVASPKAKLSKGFFPTITWNKWMNTYVALHKLPRETRISFTLYGLTPSNTAERNYNPIKQPLAWVSLRLFSSQG
jgi:phosphatidylinositol-4-phosphate 3-kinase